ncbi:Protein kinase C-like, phorbol ester/diacylglycerol-binding domain [Cinara cedri]|uniref:Protein kinase C-like, phorbol ester/diacylglycerol-binding domain n=1 Tax=Cinara cedri TaxID=506608 RepID=A0A5E4MEL2_9HEMI|nr:Protein kinase C-like, phorbol ester/diacylglycerol-binding domain [Cinara cedri]
MPFSRIFSTCTATTDSDGFGHVLVKSNKTLGLFKKCSACKSAKLWPWSVMVKCVGCKGVWHERCAEQRSSWCGDTANDGDWLQRIPEYPAPAATTLPPKPTGVQLRSNTENRGGGAPTFSNTRCRSDVFGGSNRPPVAGVAGTDVTGRWSVYACTAAEIENAVLRRNGVIMGVRALRASDCARPLTVARDDAHNDGTA